MTSQSKSRKFTNRIDQGADMYHSVPVRKEGAALNIERGRFDYVAEGIFDYQEWLDEQAIATDGFGRTGTVTGGSRPPKLVWVSDGWTGRHVGRGEPQDRQRVQMTMV